MKFYSRNVHNKNYKDQINVKKTNTIKTKVYLSDDRMHGLKHTFPTMNEVGVC